jgi:hypothetical protein
LLFHRLSKSPHLRSVTIDCGENGEEYEEMPFLVLDTAAQVMSSLLEPFNNGQEEETNDNKPNLRYNDSLPVRCPIHHGWTYIKKCDCCDDDSKSYMCCEALCAYQKCEKCGKKKVGYETAFMCMLQ